VLIELINRINFTLTLRTILSPIFSFKDSGCEISKEDGENIVRIEVNSLHIAVSFIKSTSYSQPKFFDITGKC
jgi:hypothetical protein